MLFCEGRKFCIFCDEAPTDPDSLTAGLPERVDQEFASEVRTPGQRSEAGEVFEIEGLVRLFYKQRITLGAGIKGNRFEACPVKGIKLFRGAYKPDGRLTAIDDSYFCIFLHALAIQRLILFHQQRWLDLGSSRSNCQS